MTWWGDSGHSTKLATVNKKHCHYYHYYLFDRLSQTLKNSAAVQEHLAVELVLRKAYILVGSRLPRGGWESEINKRKCLESVIKLPRGGRGTQRPDQPPIIHAKPRSEDQVQQQRGRQARSENIDQVPFNDSEWAMNALLHLLQHPDLPFGINALLVDTLLVCLLKPLDTHGRQRSRSRTSGSKLNLSEQQSSMFEIPEPRDRRFESRSGPSFAEIVKNEKTKRNQKCFA
jgi:hypothetical protein